jgi:signal transduction histidine kinase
MVYQRTEELTQAYQRLEKLDKAKTDFIQVAAHELRTPLTLISGYSGLMAEMFRGNEQVINIVSGIDTGHDRLLEVITHARRPRIDSEGP